MRLKSETARSPSGAATADQQPEQQPQPRVRVPTSQMPEQRRGDDAGDGTADQPFPGLLRAEARPPLVPAEGAARRRRPSASMIQVRLKASEHPLEAVGAFAQGDEVC